MTTIKIKPSHPSQGDFVLIDKSDFNPDVHEVYGDDQELGAHIERAPTMAELLAARDQLAERGRELNEREQSLIAEMDRVAEQARANEVEAQRLRGEAAILQAAKDAAVSAAQVPVAPATATAEKPAKAAKA
ncbi:hypothetical protein JAB1_14600 [Janthinobacterium sp. MP5059B]|uniref:hypothetical protein n=1 Tax=Janthinobacterium sp. MP5059B TaxID=1766683 RepID=UPI000874C251|nr:hypothetical protein [Janthinobacterium sp. MP5059B]OEZ50345.1 hypothetical protein JAB1_14600 [Janthinobacterium sp. MP5059B]